MLFGGCYSLFTNVNYYVIRSCSISRYTLNKFSEVTVLMWADGACRFLGMLLTRQRFCWTQRYYKKLDVGCSTKDRLCFNDC